MINSNKKEGISLALHTTMSVDDAKSENSVKVNVTLTSENNSADTATGSENAPHGCEAERNKDLYNFIMKKFRQGVDDTNKQPQEETPKHAFRQEDGTALIYDKAGCLYFYPKIPKALTIKPFHCVGSIFLKPNGGFEFYRKTTPKSQAFRLADLRTRHTRGSFSRTKLNKFYLTLSIDPELRVLPDGTPEVFSELDEICKKVKQEYRNYYFFEILQAIDEQKKKATDGGEVLPPISGLTDSPNGTSI